MAKSSRRQFLVVIKPDPSSGITMPNTNGTAGGYYFSQKSGGATTASLTKVWDGGSTQPTVLPGVAQTADLTLVKPYDPAIDQAVIAKLKPLVGRLGCQVSVTATDANLVPISGTTETYTGILAGVTPSDVDAGSSEAATFTLTFAISTVVA
jgi:hypothetical protein